MVAKMHHKLHNELASIVGAKYVSDKKGVLLSYTRDMSLFPPGKPQGIVVRPGSTEEVIEIVRLANQTCTPLIPMGGKASVAGVPPGQPGRGIIIDMTRMDKIIEIDEENMCVTAQAGITWGELAGRVNALGYDVHTAGMPHYVDTIGGHISGIPGAGFGAYGYSMGWNWHYLLGIKVVLPNGKVVDTGTGGGTLSTYRGNTWARAMHGPDMAGIFIGDGGIFGIKVEATYRMFRLPKFEKAGGRCWNTLDEAFEAYHKLWDIDPYLYMQPYAAGLILSPEFVNLITFGQGEPKWVLIFLSIGNTEEEVEFKHKTTAEICARYGGDLADPAVLAVAQNFTTFTRGMSMLATMGQMPLFELILPRRDMLQSYKWTSEYLSKALEERGIDRSRLPIIAGLSSSGTGSGITSVVPLTDQSDEELCRAIYEIQVEYLEQAIRLGYVTDATQGYQAKLRARQWTPEFYDFVLNLKKTLDPNNIVNPGVYFP
jgi:glycolate oxidase